MPARSGCWRFRRVERSLSAGAHETVVQQRQRLRGDGGIVAATATGLRIRAVERLHERLLHDAFVKHVNGAAARGGRVLQILGIGVLHVAGLNGFGKDRCLERGAEHFRIQRAADGEHGVAQDLGFDPLRTATPEQAIVRINGGLGSVEGGVLEINRTGHDQPVQRFQFPTALHEFVRQPFQQFRMRGRVAAHAEIVDRANQTLTEMMLPDAIHHHSRDQRARAVLGIGHPFRQGAPLLGGVVPACPGPRTGPIICGRFS